MCRQYYESSDGRRYFIGFLIALLLTLPVLGQTQDFTKEEPGRCPEVPSFLSPIASLAPVEFPIAEDFWARAWNRSFVPAEGGMVLHQTASPGV